VAIALVGEHLKRVVLDVAHAEPEHAQEHAALGLALDEAGEVTLVGHADVEIAIGAEDDAVAAVLDEALDGRVVGELEACAAVGRPPSVKVLERSEDVELAGT
jgi:hypothetical protein